MIFTLQHVHYEIHDEERENDKVHDSFIKQFFFNPYNPNDSFWMVKLLLEVGGGGAINRLDSQVI